MAQVFPIKSPGKIFSVGIIGVGEKWLKILERIFGETRYRKRSYQLLAINDASSAESMVALKNADIFLLNVNNPQAVLAWRLFYTRLHPERRKPVLQLDRNPFPANRSATELIVPWPLNPARLLQILDNYTIHHLDYCPEFEFGSEVDRSLNVVREAKAADLHVPATESPDSIVRQQRKVLIADDSLVARHQLKIEFCSMNTWLDPVSDGDAAVEAATHRQYDLIFLDVVMPGLDGYSACKLIRQTALNKLTPIIMLTSRSSRFDNLKGKLTGCDSYLTKPVNQHELRAIIRKYLGEKPAR